ncbi:hypothetical protein F4802DRAFT_583666 [Xylaria palmicola]|nr:hypothetical protein F4802DRAFT_583666 [Xylaria palmicola]
MSEEEKLPSYEDYYRALTPAVHTNETDRIFWTLNGPLHSSIWIMSRGALKPYAQETDESNPTWHPISQCPLTEPKVSSITVQVYELDHWEDDWLNLHTRHRDDPEPGEPLSGEGFHYGPLTDYDPEVDGPGLSEEHPVHLVECCGEPRPRGKTLEVVVQPSPGNAFVTIHDWLSTLHPRLLEARDDIIDSMCMMYDRERPAEVKLFVRHPSTSCLMFTLDYQESAHWMSHARRSRPCPVADDD